MLSFALFILRLVTPVAHAAGIEQIGSGAPGIDQMWSTIRSTFPFTDVGAGGVSFLALKVTAFILSMLSAIAALMLVYGGLKMITAGSEEGFGEAKKILIYTAAGLVCAMLADAVVIYVISILEQSLG